MNISTVNHYETIFKNPDLTKITGVPTYETLHLLHNKIKANAMEVHSNIGGVQHGYLDLVVIPTDYTLLINIPFVRQLCPGNLSILIAATHHVHEELKCQYDKNIQVLHETSGVERSLIQKIVLDVETKYITPKSNRTTGQFTCTLFILIQYLIVTYGKFYPSNLIDLEQNTKSM